jgi:hypothetical protein
LSALVACGHPQRGGCPTGSHPFFSFSIFFLNIVF